MVVHPSFWIFSALISMYALYLVADWRGQPRSYLFFGLLGFPGLVVGLILIFASRKFPATPAARTPSREPTAIARGVPAPTSAPSAPQPDEREEAVHEAERILKTRSSRKSRKPEPRDDRFAALNALREYHDLGLMSDAEFEAKRKEILFRM